MSIGQKWGGGVVYNKRGCLVCVICNSNSFQLLFMCTHFMIFVVGFFFILGGLEHFFL